MLLHTILFKTKRLKKCFLSIISVKNNFENLSEMFVLRYISTLHSDRNNLVTLSAVRVVKNFRVRKY